MNDKTLAAAESVSILGTDYKIIIKKQDEDRDFREKLYLGYCDKLKKEIAICDLSSVKPWDAEPQVRRDKRMKETLRHEIVHAFLEESGLGTSSIPFEEAWAENEEMVDWIALQGEKIYRAWQDAGALSCGAQRRTQG